MTPAKHPSAFIPRETLDEIRQHAYEAEQLRDLHPKQLDIIFKNSWFKMFVPESFGGLALSLPDALRIEEALAWADGSTAWVVTLCSGAGWFAGFLDPGISEEVFAANRVCLAGSGAVTGTAEITDGGYKIMGTWKYASGSLHATTFTANCRITKGGVAVANANGEPSVSSFIFRKDEVEVIRTWNSMGMIATGSHSFTVKDLRVPERRAFLIDAKHATIQAPVFQYPFLQLAETTLTINLSGMAQRFLDLCEPFLASPQQAVLDRARSQLQINRTAFYAAAEESWRCCNNGNVIPAQVIKQVTISSRALALASLSCVDQLYPYTGLGAADMSSEINRVWRNFHTASQHSLFTRWLGEDFA